MCPTGVFLGCHTTGRPRAISRYDHLRDIAGTTLVCHSKISSVFICALSFDLAVFAFNCPWPLLKISVRFIE